MNFVAADDPILREVMPQYEGDPRDLKAVAKEMISLMREGNGITTGIGMAAPQVGLRLRMFVMDRPRAGVVCINPRILQTTGERATQPEGCLSYPGRTVPVQRWRRLVAEWQDLNGKTVRECLVEFSARVFQHELDHLNGVCKVGE